MMGIHRFFVAGEDIRDDIFRIRGRDLHHIRDVLRLGEGASIIIVDENGIEHEGYITSVGREEVVGKVLATKPSESEPPVAVILAQGLPKGEKLDLIVRMCTEIGVSQVIPMVTQRTVPKLTASQREKRLERWRRIAGEAAKQSRRGKIPLVRGFLDFASVVREASGQISAGALALMAWESPGGGEGLRDLLRRRRPKNGEVYLIIGPEGGFSEEEVTLAESLGILMLGLGRRILRTETAGVVATSLILYELGDLGGKGLK